MAFPPKKPGPVDPEMDAMDAIMAAPPPGHSEDETTEQETAEPKGTPEELLGQIETALAELRELVAQG